MRPIDGTRQTGVFTKRIQQALLDHQADVAVHSLKDLPTETDDRLVLAAVPCRESVRDCLVSPDRWTTEQLPPGAVIGTGSRRRAAQLLSLRPDLRIEPIRGNVQTRLEKLRSGQFDAIILAEAGILRLDLRDLPRHNLSLTEMLPAPGQGALGIEVRSDDAPCLERVRQLDHVETRAAVTAERLLLSALRGGCLAPIAALAIVDGQPPSQVLSMDVTVLAHDGRQRIDHQEQVPFEPATWEQAAIQLAKQVSDEVTRRGAAELIQSQR